MIRSALKSFFDALPLMLMMFCLIAAGSLATLSILEAIYGN